MICQLLQCRRSYQYFCSPPSSLFSHVIEAESIQIYATSNWDARTTARNWHLSQSEALISCTRITHAPVTLMLPWQPELMIRLWRLHHDLKILARVCFIYSLQNIDINSWPPPYLQICHSITLIHQTYYKENNDKKTGSRFLREGFKKKIVEFSTKRLTPPL